MKYLPTWSPGAEFKRNAITWKCSVDEMFERPYRELKADLVRDIFSPFEHICLTSIYNNHKRAGRSQPCIASEMISTLAEENENEFNEEFIMSTTGTAYAGWLSLIIWATTVLIILQEVQAR